MPRGLHLEHPEPPLTALGTDTEIRPAGTAALIAHPYWPDREHGPAVTTSATYSRSHAARARPQETPGAADERTR
jgi:hypothetical protein